MNDDEIRARIPALAAGNVAVITGAASGIGLAAAKRFAALGLRLVLADRDEFKLAQAARDTNAAAHLLVDVSDAHDVARLKKAADGVGPVAVLMNNAGIGLNPGGAAKNLDAWRTLIGVNLWGVIHGTHAFAPDMIARGAPALIINTGSKQGITTPPGNAAYNVSKAGVKAFTEALAYELATTADCKVSAHLLVPGFTYTGMTARGDKPASAWTGEEVIAFMLESLARGDFYILCPDNDTPRALDEKRMQWAVDDLIKNRPALSRWRSEFKDAFARFMAE